MDMRLVKYNEHQAVYGAVVAPLTRPVVILCINVSISIIVLMISPSERSY